MISSQVPENIKAFYSTPEGKKVMNAWAEQVEQISTLWLLRTQFVY